MLIVSQPMDTCTRHVWVWSKMMTRELRWPCIAHLITRQVWVSWPFGSREEVQYWFSRWRPAWISNQNYFSNFWSTNHLDTSNEVWVHCPFGSEEKVQNRFSTWLLGQPSWICLQNEFSYFWSTRHPDTSYQIDFQDGICGGHLVFQIGTILAIYVSPL